MKHPLPGYATRGREFLELLPERILVIDGAMGTMLQQTNLSAEDFGGPDFEGCNENLVVTRPDVVRGVHEAYFAAEADIVATNTFGGMPTVLAEYGLQDRAIELNGAAARLAREAAAKFPGPRFVAGSMGPTTKTITVTGGITFDQLIASYRTQAIGLLQGGVDLLLLETAQDTRNVKAGVIAIREAFLPDRPARPAHDLRDDRADGDDARRTDHRRVLCVDRACGDGLDRPQLRDRPGIHGRPPAHPERPRVVRDQLLPERWPA